jgi:hypothetical protein
MLSVASYLLLIVMLNAIMLNNVMLCALMLNVTIMRFVMLSVRYQNFKVYILQLRAMFTKLFYIKIENESKKQECLSLITLYSLVFF